jgi:replicative DNA helicase
MKDKDEDKYNARWKATIDQLRLITDIKVQMYAVKRAKEVAAASSLQYLLSEARFQKMLDDGNAKALKAEVSKWLAKHTESEDEGLYSIQEAFDKVMTDYPWKGRAPKIGTGVYPVDFWYGGLRAPGLGIYMMPTGNGKSVALMNTARHAAAIEQRSVLFITNELTVNEQTERFLARMQQPTPDASGKLTYVAINEIQDDPAIAYQKLTGYQAELGKHLYIYSANLGQTVEDVDEIIQRVKNERGKIPDLVVIDYIERMATKVRMDRGKTWSYYGQIARELVWLAKRRDCVIWTAIQTNRSGMDANQPLTMKAAQGSIEHLQEAAIVVGGRRVKVTQAGGEELKGLEFTELKARHDAMEERSMIIECDLRRMFLSDNVIENYVELEDDDVEQTNTGGKVKPIKGQAQTKGKV